MKNISLYILSFICFFVIQTKAQTDLYTSIQINTIATGYTLTAANDTVFSRELVMVVNDTNNIQSVNISLSNNSETGWQTIQTANVTPIQIQANECSQPMCVFRRSRNVWVVFLGNYSMLSSHLVELHFDVLNGNSLDFDWRSEF